MTPARTLNRRSVKRPLNAWLALGALLALGTASPALAARLNAPVLKQGAGGDFVSVPVQVLTDAGAPAPDGTVVSAVLPEGWLAMAGAVLGGGSGNTLLNVFVPQGALAGRYRLPLRAVLPGGEVTAAELQVEIPALPLIEFSPAAGGAVQAGSVQSRTVTIQNRGNRSENLRFQADNAAQVEPAALTLAPGQSASLRVLFTVSAGVSAAVYTVQAESADKLASASSVLSVRVGSASGSAPGRPRLSASLILGASGARELTAQAAGDQATADQATGDQAAGAASPGVSGVQTALGLSLDGQLSDSVAVNAALAGGAGRLGLTGDHWGLLATLNGEGTQATGSAGIRASDAISWWDGLNPLPRGRLSFGVGGDYDLGTWQLGGGVSAGAEGFGVRADLVAPGGLGFSGAYLPGVLSAAARWSGTAGAFRLGAAGSVQRRDDALEGELSQTASYSGPVFLASQRLSVNTSGNVNLSVQGSLRASQPFGVSLAGTLGLVGGELSGSLGVRGSYRLNDVWQLSAVAALSPQGFLPGVGLSGTLLLPAGALGLDAAVNYASDTGAFAYSTRASWNSGTFSALGILTGDLQGLSGAGLSGSYQLEGAVLGGTLSVRAGLVAQRAAAGGSAPGEVSGAWQQSLQLGAAYQKPGLGLSGVYRLTHNEDGTLGQAFGAALSAQVLPNLDAQLGVTRTAASTQVSVGARLKLGASFDTPEALVALFGGRSVGTLRAVAFLDRNANGLQDPGEPGVPGLPLKVGQGTEQAGQTVQTDAQGLGTVQLPPGAYTVTLGEGAPATLILGAAPAQESAQGSGQESDCPLSCETQMRPAPEGTVARNQVTTILLPLAEGGMVSGQIVDEAGVGLAGLSIRVSGAGALAGLSDAQGNFNIGGVPYGEHSAQVMSDAQRYAALAPQAVTLSAQAPTSFVRFSLKAAVLENHAVDALDLGVSVQPPEQTIPAGVTVPVVIRTRTPADSAFVELNGERFAAQPSSQGGAGQEWTAQVRVGKDATGELRLLAVAALGKRQDSVQGSLSVDADLSTRQVTFGPRHSLPGGRMTLSVVVYGTPETITLTLPGGAAVPLVRAREQGGTSEWTASMLAPDSPGPQVATLNIGAEQIALNFEVLGLKK